MLIIYLILNQLSAIELWAYGFLLSETLKNGFETSREASQFIYIFSALVSNVSV